jgi:DNA/RNA endonuclease YhcR with UshA esterase domain
MSKIILFLIIVTTVSVQARTARISAREASSHIGERATVCGVAVSTHRARSATFINLDEPYPNHIFTAVIFADDRDAFGSPEVTLRGKKVCVRGRIKNYKGHAEIILSSPSQIIR